MLGQNRLVLVVVILSFINMLQILSQLIRLKQLIFIDMTPKIEYPARV